MHRSTRWSVARRSPYLAPRLWLLLGVTMSGPLVGQEPERPMVEVVLDTLEDGWGLRAAYQRMATPEGDLLVVRGLSTLQRTLIGVRTLDPGVPVEVALYKTGVPDPVRRATTDADGNLAFDFRTYDEVGIEVKAAAATGYLLVVEATMPEDPAAASPFVDPAGTSAPSPASSSGATVPPTAEAPSPAPADEPGATVPLRGVVLTLLVAVFGIAAFLFGRRRGAGSRAAILVVLSCAGATEVLAQGTREPLTGPGQYDRRDTWDRAQSVGDRTTPNLGPDGRLLEGPGRGRGGTPGSDHIKGGLENLDKWLQHAGRAAKFGRLGPHDGDYEPDLAPPGMPRVPSQCAVSSECKACFAPAYGSLSDVRKKLENNRIVLAHFRRRMDMIEDAGSSLAGMHGMLGVAWLREKQKMSAGRGTIDNLYDQRYTALMTDLQAALRRIEGCEASHYGKEAGGWYDRFGFMYYEFMAARYRRVGGGA